MTKNYEYEVKRSLLDVEEVAGLAREFNRVYADVESRRVHENVIQINNADIQKNELLSPIYQKIEAHFSGVFSVSDMRLAKVWFVRSQSKDTNPNALPYLPHFDKDRYLKAMIYLHDVSECHGPIHFGKLINPSDVEGRRKSLPQNYKEIGLNSFEKSDLASDMEPILGKAGDVVFFDTNAAHCAGIVKDGYERRVIRFDFDVRGFNQKPSIVSRVLNRILF